MTKNEILQKVSELTYVEGGIQTSLFSKTLKTEAKTLVVALNNADLTTSFHSLIKEKADKIIEGALLLKTVHGAERAVLHLPEEIGDETVEKYNGIANGVEIQLGMVNKRNYPAAVYHHAVTALNVAEIADGTYTDGIYASVCGKIKKYAPDTLLRDIAEENGVDTAAVVAIISGYKLFDRAALGETVGEAYPENGNVTFVLNSECEVSVVSNLLKESYAKSCGKCVFCREGLNQLALMLKDITEGKGKAGYIEITREIAGTMKYSTLCTLGQTNGEVALGLLDNFANEVTKHIKRKKCTSGVCFSNDTVYVDPKTCIGCGECADKCPKNAIDGKLGYIHMVDDVDCNRCGECISSCKVGAIKITSSRAPKLPDRLKRVGQFKTY